MAQLQYHTFSLTVHTLFCSEMCVVVPRRHEAALLTGQSIDTDCAVGVSRQTSEALHDVCVNVRPLYRCKQTRLNTSFNVKCLL